MSAWARGYPPTRTVGPLLLGVAEEGRRWVWWVQWETYQNDALGEADIGSATTGGDDCATEDAAMHAAECDARDRLREWLTELEAMP